MAVLEDVRSLGAELERSQPVYVRDRLKFRVGSIVYVALSLDESEMGFAFPKDERAGLVASEPRKFRLPAAADLRFNWVHAELGALDPREARELVVDAWRMVVPQKISRAYDLLHPDGPADRLSGPMTALTPRGAGPSGRRAASWIVVRSGCGGRDRPTPQCGGAARGAPRPVTSSIPGHAEVPPGGP